jgi:hypothetical protein
MLYCSHHLEWGDAWSPRKFYATMHHVFRVAADHPFFLAPHQLEELQYSGAADLYARARMEDYLHRFWARGGSRVLRPLNPASWPDPLPGEPEYVLTPGQKALGRGNFAATRRSAAASRAELRTLAATGNPRRREALARARKAMPQVRATFDVQDIVHNVLPYHARRQFMWNFLRYELRGGLRHLADRGETPITLKELRHDPHGLIEDLAQEIVDQLLTAYAFLGLSSRDLLMGLRDNHPADYDTAARFSDLTKGIRLSPASIRSMLARPS